MVQVATLWAAARESPSAAKAFPAPTPNTLPCALPPQMQPDGFDADARDELCAAPAVNAAIAIAMHTNAHKNFTDWYLTILRPLPSAPTSALNAPINAHLITTIDASASYPSSCSAFIAADRSEASSAFFPASQYRLTIFFSHHNSHQPLRLRRIPRHFHLIRSHCASCGAPARIV